MIKAILDSLILAILDDDTLAEEAQSVPPLFT